MIRRVRSGWRAGVGAVLAALILLIGAAAGAAPLSFTIGTSEPVIVDTTGGTPLIWLDFGGGEARAATYRAGSGTAALEFAYDIAAGNFAPAGIIAAGQIELAGGTIRDLAGNPLTLSFTPPDLSGVRVRTYRPVWTTDPITAANASAAAFEITKAPLGASFAWEITSDGGGSTSGSGTISAAPHPVTGLDLSALGDGTLTLSLTLTTAAGTSAPRTVTVAKSTPWTPADLGPALALWLDANDAGSVILNGATVSEWRDKSGNERHASQASPTDQPSLLPLGLNGLPAIQGGAAAHMTFSLTGLMGYPQTVMIVVSKQTQTANDAGAFLKIGNSSDGFGLGVGGGSFDGSGTRIIALKEGAAWIGTSDDLSDFAIISLTANSGIVAWEINQNGSPVQITYGATTIPRTPSGNGYLFGYYNSGGGFRGSSNPIGEVLVITSSITTPDRQRLEGYLAHKWGLAGSLPAGHPWKAVAP